MGFFKSKFFVFSMVLVIGFFLGNWYTKEFISASKTYNDALHCQAMGEFYEAIYRFNKTISYPASKEMENRSYYNRGYCFYMEGDYQYALPDLFRAIIAGGYDGSAYAYYLIGMTYYGLGYENRARENLLVALDKGKKYNPDFAGNQKISEAWLKSQLPAGFLEEPTKAPEPTSTPTKVKEKAKKKTSKK